VLVVVLVLVLGHCLYSRKAEDEYDDEDEHDLGKLTTACAKRWSHEQRC
jgi:hypothetical protein